MFINHLVNNWFQLYISFKLYCKIVKMQILSKDFFLQDDVVLIAKQLLGKTIHTFIDGVLAVGIISETEAYAGISDKASHAFGNRRTHRTEVMYSEGGISYVYLCYGIHSLFNIVTSRKDEPNAVLLRGIIPLLGNEIMAKRKSLSKISLKHASGPGNVTKVLGITLIHNNMELFNINEENDDDSIWLQDDGFLVNENDYKSGPRIGVDYAGEDARLPYRFLLKPEISKHFFENY